MRARKKTRQIWLGQVAVGGDAPVSVQSMTNTPTDDIDATVSQIMQLSQAGCDIVRVAVPDFKAIEALPHILNRVKVPIVADIHFDYRLALGALECNIQCLRINPGNIGSSEKIQKVVEFAKQRKIPMRIGVNAGSLEKKFLRRDKKPTAAALVESAVAHAAFIEGLGFQDFKISVKASDVWMAIDAYRGLSQKCDYPLHVGITEAGTLSQGTVKSSVGVGIILSEGIGDTIRISLTADPIKEVMVGWEILKALGLRHRGVNLVSCPSCGRCASDFIGIVNDIEQDLQKYDKPLTVAVMGCEVNGPGEARDADIGIAFGAEDGLLFKRGRKLKKVSRSEAKAALFAQIESMDVQQEVDGGS